MEVEAALLGGRARRYRRRGGERRGAERRGRGGRRARGWREKRVREKRVREKRERGGGRGRRITAINDERGQFSRSCSCLAVDEMKEREDRGGVGGSVRGAVDGCLVS
jgi:hypothetical protein